MELREYQKDAISKVKAVFRQGRRSVCVVLPCRAGKSIIAASIAKSATDKGSRVLFFVHRKELCAQIAETFSRTGVDMSLCTVGMVQTLTRRISQIDQPDLIICDEAHHTAETYQRIYKAFPNALRIGFTATPIRMNEGGLGDTFEELVIGVTAEYLIENDFMAPYKYYNNKLVNLQGVRVRMGDYDLKIIDERMDSAVVYSGAIENYLKYANGTKAIVYCTSVKNAQTCADGFNAAGIPAGFITGSQSTQDRERAMIDFRSGAIKILSSCEVISEGIDIADCECCILMRPTKSLGLYIQQSMRCLTYKPGKTAIILDLVGNVMNHGMPTQDRQWSLDAKKKSGVKSEIAIKTCPKCFSVLPSSVRTCDCGHVFGKEEKEGRPAELEELDMRMRFVRNYADCKTIDEMLMLARRKGHKAMAVLFKAKAYGLNITYEDLRKIQKQGAYHWRWCDHKALELGIPKENHA